MAYSAQHAKYFHSVDSTAYTLVGGLESIDGFSAEDKIGETTNLDSTAVTRIPLGVRDYGSFTINCQHNDADAGQTVMETNQGRATFGRITVDTNADGLADVNYDFAQIVSKRELSDLKSLGIPMKKYSISINGDVTKS